MDITHLLNGLNPGQREAVCAPPGPLLVLAGAGSGKTRVLTHRVAWVLATEGLSPHAILAVTFTNKAAHEMRGRIEAMLGAPVSGMWIGTFHGLSHRLLRAHWREANLPQTFQILDAEDQYRAIRRVLKALELEEQYWPPRQAQWFINGHKDAGRRPQHLPDGNDPHTRTLTRVYREYEAMCQRSGLVDFAELLLRAWELLRDNSAIRGHYQARFRHVLVDEFQDTNAIQYAWLKLMCGGTGNLFAVGDDDQSVYGWRGALVDNMLRFEKDNVGARLLRLEQNYRSTQTILSAANQVIRNNDGRLGKELWTEGPKGEPIKLFSAYNDFEEARFVVDRVAAWTEAGGKRAECAVLYRSNAQSRVIEEALIAASVPYRVYGGLRFFERAEIKDALAYLRLIANRADDASFERVVNVPTRGIGDRTIEAVRTRARAETTSLWESATRLVQSGELAARAAGALRAFLQLIERLAHEAEPLSLGEKADLIVRGSGLLDYHKADKSDRAESRAENLEELASAAGAFEYEPSEEMTPLDAFLAHAALEAGEREANPWEDCVQLMSLHAAKGLEFPVVFLTGLEEGLFPHQRSVDEPAKLEEERRLCYVGMTRAMKSLFITYAENRRLHGQDHYTTPSRFLSELPPECVEEVRARPQRSTISTRTAMPPPGPVPGRMRLGSRVRHTKFGEGVILTVEGQGEHTRVQVNFAGLGAKWLVAAYANLEML
jgi:DNA helicase-2/ATP-dependent DNA helicase PcrA